MAALITLDRARQAIPNFPSADDTILQDIVNASSTLIERYCNRTFALTSYDELLDGPGPGSLLLTNYPVFEIDRISYNAVSVLQIKNNDYTNSRALVRMDATTLYLQTVKAGVTTNNNLTLASYPTIADLATAISALSSVGWHGLGLGIYATWPVADLRPPQGAVDALYGTPYIKLHAFHLFDFEMNPDIGEIVSPLGFTRGYRNYRVLYKAGFTDGAGNSLVPEPIQQACAELAASVYFSRNVNVNLNSESLGEYSYTTARETSFKDLSIASTEALSQYKSWRIPKFRVS